MSKGFDPTDIKAMKINGIAPQAPQEQWRGELNGYQIHYNQPIHDGGKFMK